VLTELGTLELWCVSAARAERWRLEFELRGETSGGSMTVTEALPARFDEARAAVERVFGHKPLPVGSKEVKQLRRTLETTLGPRAECDLGKWPASIGGTTIGKQNDAPSRPQSRTFRRILSPSEKFRFPDRNGGTPEAGDTYSST